MTKEEDLSFRVAKISSLFLKYPSLHNLRRFIQPICESQIRLLESSGRGGVFSPKANQLVHIAFKKILRNHNLDLANSFDACVSQILGKSTWEEG